MGKVNIEKICGVSSPAAPTGVALGYECTVLIPPAIVDRAAVGGKIRSRDPVSVGIISILFIVFQ